MHFVFLVSEFGPEPGHNKCFLNTCQVTSQETLYISPRDTQELDNAYFQQDGSIQLLTNSNTPFHQP